MDTKPLFEKIRSMRASAIDKGDDTKKWLHRATTALEKSMIRAADNKERNVSEAHTK